MDLINSQKASGIFEYLLVMIKIWFKSFIAYMIETLLYCTILKNQE